MARPLRFDVFQCVHGLRSSILYLLPSGVWLGIWRACKLGYTQAKPQWGILADPPAIENGRLQLPGKPGLGVSLAESVAERFPYIEGHYAIEVGRSKIRSPLSWRGRGAGVLLAWETSAAQRAGCWGEGQP